MAGGLTHKERGRLGGLALAAKVEPDYFRFIGRRGGKRYMFNLLMDIARTWEFSPEEIEASKVSADRRAELVADMREHYRSEAYEKYFEAWGNRVMIELFQLQQLDGGPGQSLAAPRPALVTTR
jgi:hypothetical protein